MVLSGRMEIEIGDQLQILADLVMPFSTTAPSRASYETAKTSRSGWLRADPNPVIICDCTREESSRCE
jgi:hypothetical protein